VPVRTARVSERPAASRGWEEIGFFYLEIRCTMDEWMAGLGDLSASGPYWHLAVDISPGSSCLRFQGWYVTI
jgi:hypothetical protein